MEIKNNIIFSIIKITNSLLSQLLFLLLFYILSIDDFGHFISVLAISMLLQVITTGFTYGAFINFSAKSFSKSSVYSTVLYHRLIITIFVTICIIFVFSFISFEDKFLILKLYIGLVLYDLGSQLLLPSKRKLLQVIIELLFFIILFIVVIVNVENFIQYINYYFLLSLNLFLFTFVAFYKLCNSEVYKILNYKDNVLQFKYFFKYSLWQLIGILGIYTMGNGLNLYTYFYNFSPSDIAKYGIILKIFMSLSPIYALFIIFIPKIMRSQYFLKYDSMPYFKTIFVLSIILTILYFIVITIFQYLIIYLNKLEYEGIYKFLFLLLPAYFFMSFSNISNTMLSNTNKYKHPQFIFVIQAVVLCILYVIFIPVYNLKGFVISITLTYLVSCLLFLYTLLRRGINLL